jgi:hypothetical protein
MPDANELLRINHEVTSERDPEKRRAAIERAYVEDLAFIDSAGEVVGRQAFSDRVEDSRRRSGRLRVGGGRPGVRRSRYRRPGLAVRPARPSRDPRNGRTHAA